MAPASHGGFILDLSRSQRVRQRGHVSSSMVDAVSKNPSHHPPPFSHIYRLSHEQPLTSKKSRVFPIQTMTPVWVFPAYPLLLTAPLATNIIAGDRVGPYDPKINRLAIAVAGVTVQGTGFLISFMISAAFIYRLMTQKLPRDMQRPGMVSCVHLFICHLLLFLFQRKWRLKVTFNCQLTVTRVVHFHRTSGVYSGGTW